MHEVYNRSLEGYSFADLHMHTTGSLDVRRRTNGMAPREAVLSAADAGLTALAITDHDFLPSSYEAWDFSQKEGLKVDVIPGMELTTTDGHLIVLGLTSPIEKGLSMEESIKQTHRQKGLVIAPHPFFRILKSPKRRILSKIIRSKDPEIYFDGFETYNTGVEDVSQRKRSIRNTNDFTQRLYANHEVQLGAAIGSSDGHRMTVGRGLTAFKDNLFDAIRNRTTMAVQMDFEDNRRLVMNAIKLFGEERVLEGLTLEEFERRRRHDPLAK